MIQWLKNLLTAPKKSAKIVKRWVVRPNADTTDELYDYITQKEQKKAKTTEHERIHTDQNRSTEGRP
tara:strand:+ start:85 stop:285 length:201 start_codon:yes stop_codon:yes gene_type:complete